VIQRSQPTCQGPFYLSLDSNNVYWSAQNDGSILEVPRAGGTATVLAPSATFTAPAGISVDGTNIYVASGSSIFSIPKTGLINGIPPSVKASNQVNLTHLAASSGHLNWANAGTTANTGMVVQVEK
jgi:hypothetical protein